MRGGDSSKSHNAQSNKYHVDCQIYDVDAQELAFPLQEIRNHLEYHVQREQGQSNDLNGHHILNRDND